MILRAGLLYLKIWQLQLFVGVKIKGDEYDIYAYYINYSIDNDYRICNW